MGQKAAHTPGPWVVESFGDSYEVVVEESLVTIAAVRRFSGREEANADLIAAAPDLLAALIGVVKVADRATVEFDAARAAIAKATGAAP